MTPPSDTMNMSNEMDSDILNRLRWLGWMGLGAVVLSWAGWVSLSAIRTAVVEERQNQQFQLLREDIADLKALLKQRR